MKTSKFIFRRKALAFLGAAAVLLAAVFTAGCANGTNDSTTGGTVKCIAVAFGTNGAELDTYLKTKASDTDVNYSKVIGLTASDLKGIRGIGISTPSPLGEILDTNPDQKGCAYVRRQLYGYALLLLRMPSKAAKA